jgi:hypothetical protein
MALTYGQTKDALCAAITATLPEEEAENAWVWVSDFSDSYVVYEIGGGSYLQDDYSIDADGSVTLAGDPQPVKAITTYEPLGRPASGEVRVLSSPEGGYQQMLVRAPEQIASLVASQMRKLSRAETGSDLVYTPNGPHSYYRDFILAERGRPPAGAGERLTRHREQTEAMRAAWEARAWERLTASGMEYRVTPDRTDGFGGYFAPPLWLNQLFATANRPGRVLAGLMPRFPLPPGVSSINVPVIGTGTGAEPQVDDTAVLDQDFTDSAASSNVAALSGQADVALQLLEQSPAGAHLDWAIFMDLSEAYDYSLEQQLVTGVDGGTTQLLGVTNVSSIISVAYTDSSPTGSEMWTPLSKVPAQIGDARLRPPECWLMRTARWAWMQGSEDTGMRPFGLSTRFFIGNDDDTPDPVSGMMGWPVFLNDAIPATFGGSSGLTVGAGTQDIILCLRPRDLILLEGQPQTMVAREPLSGSMGVRLQMHCNAAAITGRRPAGIGVLQGTGMTVQSGY